MLNMRLNVSYKERDKMCIFFFLKRDMPQIMS